MGGGKYEGQGMMVGHRGEGEHGLLIIRQHGVEEQYSNVSSENFSPNRLKPLFLQSILF